MKISVSHILVAHEYEARDILKKLEKGADFEELARDFSICSSAKNNGHLGEIKRGTMVKTFEKAAYALLPGEISGIVRTQFGHHIIKRN